jgi:hypothetical protein
MVSFHLTGQALWDRMERAVQKIQERLERTATTLEQAGVPYAIIGGNAVRAWVAQVDEAAVRGENGTGAADKAAILRVQVPPCQLPASGT